MVRSEPIHKKNDIGRSIRGRHEHARRTCLNKLNPLFENQPYSRAELSMDPLLKIARVLSLRRNELVDKEFEQVKTNYSQASVQ